MVCQGWRRAEAAGTESRNNTPLVMMRRFPPAICTDSWEQRRADPLAFARPPSHHRRNNNPILVRTQRRAADRFNGLLRLPRERQEILSRNF